MVRHDKHVVNALWRREGTAAQPWIVKSLTLNRTTTCTFGRFSAKLKR